MVTFGIHFGMPFQGIDFGWIRDDFGWILAGFLIKNERCWDEFCMICQADLMSPNAIYVNTYCEKESDIRVCLGLPEYVFDKMSFIVS